MTTNDNSRAWAHLRNAIVELREAARLGAQWSVTDLSVMGNANASLTAIARRRRQPGDRDARDPQAVVKQSGSAS